MLLPQLHTSPIKASVAMDDDKAADEEENEKGSEDSSSDEDEDDDVQIHIGEIKTTPAGGAARYVGEKNYSQILFKSFS